MSSAVLYKNAVERKPPCSWHFESSSLQVVVTSFQVREGDFDEQFVGERTATTHGSPPLALFPPYLHAAARR